jgi:hypothetical protein
MTIVARAPLLVATLLRLGRVSNLPTVWTNVLAGAVLSGGDWRNWRLGLMLVAMSSFYVGGMYLNDYFGTADSVRPDLGGRSRRDRLLSHRRWRRCDRRDGAGGGGDGRAACHLYRRL